MKQKLCALLLCSLFLVGLTGCGKENREIELSLETVNQRLSDYFTEETTDISNWSYHYIDEEKDAIIIGLFDNSEQKQEELLQDIFDSEEIKEIQEKGMIQFEEGQPLTDDTET